MASSPFLRVFPSDAPQIPLRAFQRPVGTSFLVHGGFAAGAYILGMATDRVDYKDYAWAAAPVANAWYQAIGLPVLHYGLPLSVAFQGLSWRQGLLLGGTTAWGLRLLFQVSSTSVQRGHDDVRYTKLDLEQEKIAPSFWSKASLTTFLPEALIQTLISLPVAAVMRSTAVRLVGWNWLDTLAIGLFSAGFSLEVLADSQKAQAKKIGVKGMYREGVWSLVRHPNYLGDALTHLSFALLALSTPTAHPALFLGPVANYVFLRFIGGDAQSEPAQEERYNQFDPAKERQLQRYRADKNAFWPKAAEAANPWAWALVAIAAAGIGAEKVARSVLKPGLL